MNILNSFLVLNHKEARMTDIFKIMMLKILKRHEENGSGWDRSDHLAPCFFHEF